MTGYRVLRSLGLAALLLALAASGVVGEPRSRDPFAAVRMVPLHGRPAPDLALSTLDGRRFALADVKGRPVLVYFWATW